MSTELVLAIAGLVTGLLGGIGGTVAAILAEYEAAYQRLKEELAEEKKGRKEDVERLTRLANDQTRALDAIHEMHARCDRELAQQQVWIGFASRTYGRVRTILQAAGQDPGELPEPPERECTLKESEFIKRETQQEALLVQHLTPPSLPPGGKP